MYGCMDVTAWKQSRVKRKTRKSARYIVVQIRKHGMFAERETGEMQLAL